jgi:hypothetical protein
MNRRLVGFTTTLTLTHPAVETTNNMHVAAAKPAGR